MPENVFNSKIAGQPAWVIIGGAAVLVGGFLWWRHHQAAQAAASNSTAYGSVPTAATSEELMAAGLYQPPNITYNVPPPDVGTQLASGSPPPTGSTLPAGMFKGLDGVLYNLSDFWNVGGVLYPKWQFATPPPQGSPGSVGVAQWPQQGSISSSSVPVTQQQTQSAYWPGVYSRFVGAVPPSAVAYQSAITGTQQQMTGSGAASSHTGSAITGAARTGLAPTRAWARKHRQDVFSPLFPSRGHRVA